MSVERFVSAKQLSSELAQMGAAHLGYRACLSLVNDMRARGMPCCSGRMVRPSDAYSFILGNPGWVPFPASKRKPKK